MAIGSNTRIDKNHPIANEEYIQISELGVDSY
jgi:hypothetical protein